MHFDEILFEQASLRNHDDITGPQRDVAFEVRAGFISLVVEHENRLTPAWLAPSYLDAPPRAKVSNPSRKGDRLHQGCRLPDDIGARPYDLPGDEDFGLEVFLGNILWRVCYGNRHIEMVVLVVVFQSGDQDFLKGLGGQAASADVTNQWEANFSAAVHDHRPAKLAVLHPRHIHTVATFHVLSIRSCD